MENRSTLMRLVELMNRTSNLGFVEMLSHIVDQAEHDALSTAFVNVSAPANRTLPLIHSLINSEFNRAAEGKGTIMRNNSVASKVMGTYCRRIGKDYLRLLFAEFVHSVIDDTELSFEIDPNLIQDEKKDEALQRNVNALQSKAEQVFQKIVSPQINAHMPREVRAIAGFIANNCKLRGYDDQIGPLVGGFLMLRFFNPSLITPESYGFLQKGRAPPPYARRNLILLTKVMQNLSNGIPFGGKESWMVPMNPFIEKHKDEMKKYFIEVSTDPLVPEGQLGWQDCINPDPLEVPFYGLGTKDLNVLHRIVYNNRNKLVENFSDFQELLGIIDQLRPPPAQKKETPLYLAAQAGDAETIKNLLKEGTCDIHSTIKGDPEWNPLFWAMEAQRNHENKMYLDTLFLEVCLLLIQNGADVNVLDESGRAYTPLQKFSRIAWSPKDQILQLEVISFLVAGGDVNYTAKAGETALHLATFEGVEESVQFLLRNGAKVNHCNSRGYTCLHYAIQNGKGFPSIVMDLLMAGADVDMKGYMGKTARELAEYLGRDDILRILDDFEKMSSSRPDPKSWRISKPLETSQSNNIMNQSLSRSASIDGQPTPLSSSGNSLTVLRRPPPKLGSRIKKTEKNENREEAAIIIQSQVRTWIDMRRHRSLFLKYQKWNILQGEVAKKILSTEEKYVKDLAVMKNLFVEPLKHVLSQEDQKSLFCDIEQIYEKHKYFYEDLDSYFTLYATEANLNRSLGSILQTLGTILALYSNYFTNHKKAIILLGQLKKSNSQISSFLQDVNQKEEVKENGKGRDLVYFLELPIKRALQYEHLIQHLLENVPRKYSDREDIVSALESIKKSTANLIKGQKKSENLHRVVEIQEHLVGKTISYDSTRLYLCDAPLTVLYRDATTQVFHFFLFTDVLLTCKQVKKTNKIKGLMYEVKKEYFTRYLTFLDVPNYDGIIPNGIQMVYFPPLGLAESFTVLCPSNEEKDMWLDKFRARTEFASNMA